MILIGENKYEDLKYYEGDNTEKLANKFALKFNLDPEAVSLVAAQLKAKVE